MRQAEQWATDAARAKQRRELAANRDDPDQWEQYLHENEQTVLDQLEERIANGGEIDTRKAAGQLFARLTGKDSSWYDKKNKGKATKLNVFSRSRSPKLNDNFKNAVSTRATIHVKQYSKIDNTIDTMLDFGSLVEFFGIYYNRQRAIALGMKTAETGIALGRDGLGHDTLAECPLYMKVKQEHAQIFEEAWKLFEETKSTTGPAQPQVANEPDPKKHSPKKRPAAVADASSSTTSTSDTEPVDPLPNEKKAKTPFEAKFAEALNFRTKMKAARQEANGINTYCEAGDPSWSFAKNSVGYDELKTL